MVVAALSLCALAPAQWKADVSSASIPARAAAGSIAGTPFTPDRVELRSLGMNTAGDGKRVMDRAQAYTLTLRQGKKFFADKEFQVFFATEPGQKLDGLVLTFRPFAFGTKGFRDQQYPPGKAYAVGRGITGVHRWLRPPGSSGQTEMFLDRFSARIEFGKRSGKRLPGKVYLCLPDSHKSFVVGSFTAIYPE
jgi:hypothetical protein